MRLGTCIAMELLVAATTISALGASAWAVRDYLDSPPAPAIAAAPAPPAPPAAVVEPAPIVVAEVPDAAPPPDAAVDDRARPAWAALGDEAAVAPLRTGQVTAIKFNRGGTSLSLRIDFDNGARAAFKPEQVHPQSNPRREIAAYRLDRLLGLDRVPPAVGRTFTLAELEAAVAPGQRHNLPRLRTEAIHRKGVVKGELSWWIPAIREARIAGFGIDETDGIVTWKRYLRAGAEVPAEHAWLVRQISDVIVFDFLLDNTDRWSGNNAQIGEGPDAEVLYFMDNTLALTNNPKGHRKSRTYLARVQTFSRRLIARLRALTEDEVRAAIAGDPAPFEALMTEREIAALMARRDRLLEYVDGLVAEHGEDKVLAFP